MLFTHMCWITDMALEYVELTAFLSVEKQS